MKPLKALIPICALAVQSLGAANALAQDAGPITEDAKEFQAIAEEAYVYAFPMLVAYKVLYDYNVDRNSGAFKAPFNQIASEVRVYTPEDTAVSTPNSDTPYAFVQLDLRAEPRVVCVPEVDKGRDLLPVNSPRHEVSLFLERGGRP